MFANFNSYQAEQQRGVYSWLWFNATRNSIDNKTTYDNLTGVRTTMPMNIDGNWNGGGGVGFNTGLGKQKLSTYFLGKMCIRMIATPDEEIIVSKDKVATVKRWLDS